MAVNRRQLVGRLGKTETLVRYLQNMILNDNLDPKKPLPSFQQLGYQFDVSRATVEKALARVAELGLIRREKGRGIYPLPPDERTGPIDVYFGLGDLTTGEGSLFWEIFKGISAGAVAIRRDTRMLSSLIERGSVNDLPEIMADRSIFGLIAFGTYEEDLFLKLRDLGWPTVALDFDTSTLGLDCVVNDNIQDSFELTNMLLSRGCTNLLHIMPVPGPDGKQRDPDHSRRRDGFVRALEASELGLAEDSVLVRDHRDEDAVRDFLAKKRPDAIISDQGMITGLEAIIAELDLVCEYACFCGASYRPFPDFMKNAISTNYDFMEMGRRGVDLLLNRLRSGRGRVERAVIPMRISNNEAERLKILFND